jgi:hypothetical protein
MVVAQPLRLIQRTEALARWWESVSSHSSSPLREPSSCHTCQRQKVGYERGGVREEMARGVLELG